jgi:hypothetical protein
MLPKESYFVYYRYMTLLGWSGGEKYAVLRVSYNREHHEKLHFSSESSWQPSARLGSALNRRFAVSDNRGCCRKRAFSLKIAIVRC